MTRTGPMIHILIWIVLSGLWGSGVALAAAPATTPDDLVHEARKARQEKQKQNGRAPH